VWNNETRNPGGNECLCARGRGNGGKRNGFDPTGCSVNHGEDVGISLGNGKGANNVHVDMGKTTFWNGDGKRRRGDMSVGFCFLARKALAGPLIDIGGHAGPNKTGRNETACGFDSRMTE
jgi:hypothetical protein